MAGIVYIIGAGPGDPGLITVRGLQCLQSAEVVLHDHLVHPRLLRNARADAEIIDVGLASPQPLDQEAICYLLAEKAREGKTVARLKWGDPFVFDRAGAEALFLHEQGFAFEVVPGVPAGIAHTSYAGIPVTYPGGGDTLTFVRGYEDEGSELPPIDWKSISQLDGTLLCFVGSTQLPRVVEALLEVGRSPDEPVALIYNGTLPTQKTIAGTLADIAAQVEEANPRLPAILVVGRVVALRDHLRWFDTRPLFGRRILVTRPKHQAPELVELLEALGAETIEAPMIRILPPEDPEPLEQACRTASRFDWIVFTSANAVDAFMSRLFASPLDIRALHGPKLCAVGPATAERLARHGLKVDLVPSEYKAEGVSQALAVGSNLNGAKVLLPRADIGRELIANDLRQLGADVTEVIAYRTVATEADREGDPDVYGLLLERKIDVVTFASASAVRNFVNLLGPEPAADLLSTTTVAAVGPVTANAAAKYGIQTSIMPAQYTIPALARAIVEYFQVPT
ncbi:MAG TPA: uroporphyrinogen-III C-methyltransferase [Vicinamibacterales bacterium]|jgi:uroporphyrinogen III methyltransferase/synthase|nr:uroporphyrinogen-III C-methyltransferase [Vicinamibacterales bacterium]